MVPGVVIGGSAGWALIIGDDARLGITYVRTEDGGRTWSLPQQLTSNFDSNDIQTSANGRRLAIATQAPTGNLIWTSADGGRTFKMTSTTIENAPRALRIDADGTLLAIFAEDLLRVRKSTDDGKTFDDGIATMMPASQEIRLGRKTVFAISEDARTLQVRNLETLKLVQDVPGIAAMSKFRRVLEVTPNDGLFITQEPLSGSTEMRWLPPGGTMFSAARVIGFVDQAVSATALSDSALALAVQRQDRVWVSVEVTP
jgi:hypothetical protein